MTIRSPLLADMLRESIQNGQTPYLTLISHSMSPLLKKGEQIGLEGVAVEMLRPGDIVVCDNGQQLITHRFWGLADGQLITRGDRSLAFDQPWPPAALVGRVISRRNNHHPQQSLVTGSGRWLTSHLAWLAKWEVNLFAGFKPSPWQSSTTFLGRSLAANQQNLVARFIRRLILIWATLLVRLFANPISRGIMVSRQNVLTVMLFIFIASLLLVSGRVQASVQLASFSAVSDPNGIKLVWVTGNELDSIGFQLWRGQDCNPESSELILSTSSQYPGQPIGATYQFVDNDVVPNVNYDYRLKSLNSDGDICHQDFPVVASFNPGGAIGGGGSGGDEGNGEIVPTSTPAPTQTPLPAGTVAPTNPPPANATTSPTPVNNETQPTVQPAATATLQPPAGDNISDDSPPTTSPNENESDVEENSLVTNNPLATAVATDISVQSEPQSNPTQEITSLGSVEADPAGNNPNSPSATLIGNGISPTAQPIQDSNSPPGRSISPLVFAGLGIGLIIILCGGLATLILLLKKR